MAKIKTIFITNHSHTDIGFTDYQDLCFHQHARFVDQALDLCDATADYPEEARYHWTCEVTGTTERYFQQASQEQVDRFLVCQAQGGISVAGMQYNLTPLLNMEQMIRSLYPVRRLRENYGVTIDAAMQSDVNGVSWIFSDLLLDVGIDFFTMSVNPSRGGVPKPMPTGFWWETPSGRKLLTWNGYHYLFGRNIAKLADWRFVEESLGNELARLEADDSYPFDFMYCQSTHPIRVDNGPPDIRLADFVRDWNAAGREPRMVLTNPSLFGKELRDRYGDALPTWRGDWLDWWSDGAASSAYETGMNRTTHELLEIGESLGAINTLRGAPDWSIERAARVYEDATLYDEHTWGGFASIERPHERWVKAQWNRKAGFAYQAFSEAHDLIAQQTDTLLTDLGEPGPEGMFNLGDLDPDAAYPHADHSKVLVVNTLPWDRDMVVDEPELRGHAAPAGMLDYFFPRNVGWGGVRPDLPLRRVKGRVPGLGYAFIPTSGAPGQDDLVAGEHTIENVHYRVRIDPATGAIAEWYDKDLDRQFAGSYQGWGLGQYVYEWVDSPKQRDALFYNDFSAEDFGTRYTDTPFVRETVTDVVVEEPVIDQDIISISVSVKGPGIASARCTYTLHSQERVLGIDWVLDKNEVTDVEAVFIALPFALGEPRFRADLNGLPLTPEDDQLAGSVRDWYPIGRWVDVSDDGAGVTVVPLEAPLMHLGGITTGKWAQHLEPEGPTLMSWALNNHWMVNFKASQGGEIPLRYRLTTHAQTCDDVAADRFAREQVTPPVVLREITPKGSESGWFVAVDEGSVQLVHIKVADFGEGLILRLQNLSSEKQPVTLRFNEHIPQAALRVTPDERDTETLTLNDASLTLDVGGMSVQSIRLLF